MSVFRKESDSTSNLSVLPNIGLCLGYYTLNAHCRDLVRLYVCLLATEIEMLTYVHLFFFAVIAEKSLFLYKL